ncbi:MAG TPA: hypothetical protein DEB73_01360 [Candidatus Magasanikbacteria bacterium]|nr:hypothetical protein [Candidatus Magasanikbacteria bacterium]HBX15949.1 hypothetical protein [Candidatus Magasanikbacteria bacterium]
MSTQSRCVQIKKKHIHKNLATGRWFQMSLVEQLGNVGSEVRRAVNWTIKGNAEQSNRALERAFDLLDLTIGDSRWIGSKLKELCRVREVLADTFYGDRAYGATPQSMEKYFFHYAIEARNGI